MTQVPTKFPNLFRPGQIGPLELRNRLVMTAMGNNLVEDGMVTDRLIAYYLERAKGGAAMIVAGGCQINEGLAKSSNLLMNIGHQRFLPKLSELATAIRQQGTVAAVQLLHSGSSARPTDGETQPVSASSFVNAHSRLITRELTVPEIVAVEHEFAEATLRAKEAGFQLVELNCCSGYLIREFLSPRNNKRADQYGGSLENRLRFLLETLSVIRDAVGARFPIVCRLTGDEFLEGGHRLDEAVAIARAVESAGTAAIDVTVGGHETTVPLTTGSVPRAAYSYYARQIRQAVSIPVIYATRVNTPDVAEAIVRDGAADFVGMVRALNADPSLPMKAAASRTAEITPCVACHQGCYDQLFSDKPIFCLVNPRAAFELERPVEPAVKRKRVLVIGGGPGGMEAAIVAAERGHSVVLVEKSDRVGGQLPVLSAPPGKGEFAMFLSHLEAELARRGVEVILNQDATPATVAHLRPDAVIVATGSASAGLPVEGANLPHVFDAHQVLRGDVRLGRQVVVVGGNAVGIETALFAATRGALDAESAVYLASVAGWDPARAIEHTKRARAVTVLEMTAKAGIDLGRTTRWSTMLAIRNAGVDLMTDAKVLEITQEAVRFEKGGTTHAVPADTVILAVGARPNNSLVEALQGLGAEVHIIGDANRPRKAADAIREGFLVASAL